MFHAILIVSFSLYVAFYGPLKIADLLLIINKTVLV